MATSPFSSLCSVVSSEPEPPKPRKDRPCDACRKRKSRCVLNEGSTICVLCDFHSQACTFLYTPQPRKRKLNDLAAEEKSHRRRPSSSKSPETEAPARKLPPNPENAPSSPPKSKPAISDYATLKGPSLLKKTLGLQSHRHSRYVGQTTELEPYVLNLTGFDRRDEGSFFRNTIRKVTHSDLFIMEKDDETDNYVDELNDLEAIEATVAPHGPALISLYFRIVHPSFPILHKRVYLEKYGRTYREFSPPLLAAVYILALNWWAYSVDLAELKKPDVKKLEQLALKSIRNVMQRPKLSTVQAGLLLLQRAEGDSWSLTAQLIVIGQGLGLHLDCSDWKIPTWEQSLRRRLAWGLYMQDKWGALIYGRPPQLHEANWAVRPVTEDDFPENAADESEEEGSTEVRKGMMLFTQMITLTKILSEILDNFYSLRAISEVKLEGSNATLFILKKAKPIQIKLKSWFTALPDCLRMDSTKVMKLSSTGMFLLHLRHFVAIPLTILGYLHLAYFATEITLHRCIIRTITTHSSPSLLQICRSAARARLISSIEFVYNLRPEHLQSFWYFASKTNLAIIGTFGSLLWATSEGVEEAEYYRQKLGEYKWTLKVSSKGVEWFGFAIGIIDASTALLSEVCEKGLARKGSSGEGADANPQEVTNGVQDQQLALRELREQLVKAQNLDFLSAVDGTQMQLVQRIGVDSGGPADDVYENEEAFEDSAGFQGHSFGYTPENGYWVDNGLEY